MQLRYVVVILLVTVKVSTLADTLTKNTTKSFYRSFGCLKEYQCKRTSKPITTIDPAALKAKKEHTSLASCRLVCGGNAGLWPIPTGFANYSKSYVRINPLNIQFDTKAVPISTLNFLADATSAFIGNLQLNCGAQCEILNSLTMTVGFVVETDDINLNWGTPEGYSLNVVARENEVVATITAKTMYGARHGLESLSQLTAPVLTEGGGQGLVILDQAYIEDSPKFAHRGLLIDTARNFLPVSRILRTIDALAANKMNILHWHATDSQSFPLEIRSRPRMTQYGAYSPSMIYSTDDFDNIVSYAKSRGVRVILEIDSPSHVGAGWEWGPFEDLGKLAVCVNRQPWRDYCVQPPCGQINPVNPNTYDVLRDIYRELLSVMGPQSILHLGGDEVFINCWNTTDEITSVMESRGMGRNIEDFFQIWSEFHTKQAKIIDEVKRQNRDSIIVWSSALTNPEYIERFLDKTKFVIQTWVETDSDVPEELLKLGYRLIVSTKNSWYLDHGFWGKTQYHTWRDAYNNKIPRMPGVLGGEACMWGEYVNGGGLDSRVWPRAAAVAERLWSDPLFGSTADAEPRLYAQKMRLERRGIFADALAPEWCAQHERMCT